MTNASTLKQKFNELHRTKGITLSEVAELAWLPTIVVEKVLEGTDGNVDNQKRVKNAYGWRRKNNES